MTFNTNIPIEKSVISILAIIFLIAGCSALRDIANIQKPELSVTDVRVTDFTFEDIELTYIVTVDNPNSLSVQMDSYNYDFRLREKTFLEGRQDKNMEIKAANKSTFEVPIQLNFKKVYDGIKTLVNADEASYEFLSVVSFDLPVLGVTDIPVSKKGSLPMIDVPKIIIKDLEIKNLSLTRADLVLNMEFDNPNAFGINVNNFNYDLTINGDRWAEGNALGNTSISKKGTSQLQIPISLNITEMSMSAYRLLTGSGEVNYSLNGNFSLGTTHPLLDQTNLSVNRSGSLPLSGIN